MDDETALRLFPSHLPCSRHGTATVGYSEHSVPLRRNEISIRLDQEHNSIVKEHS
jgi:hypothetical protein